MTAWLVTGWWQQCTYGVPHHTIWTITLNLHTQVVLEHGEDGLQPAHEPLGGSRFPSTAALPGAEGGWDAAGPPFHAAGLQVGPSRLMCLIPSPSLSHTALALDLWPPCQQGRCRAASSRSLTLPL